MTETKERLGIQSAEIAAHVLATMTRLGRPVPLRDIAVASEMPPGKVHRYLVSLVRTGLVAQERPSGYYSIGPQGIRMGLAGLRTLDVVKCAGEFLPLMRDRTGETAVLAIWTDKGPVVTQLEESERQVYMNVRVGSILPLLRTATGRAFAAHLSSRELEEIMAAEPVHKVADKDRPRIDSILEDVRIKGYSIVRSDLVPGIAAVAAPVFNHRNKVAAAIGVIGRQDDLEPVMDTVIVPTVVHTADSFSSRMGAEKTGSPVMAAQ